MCVQPYFLKKKKMYVPCGHCIQCKEKYSLEWSYRIAFEARDHEFNSFITLTYDNEHLPENGSLVRKDFQDFMKRLRKKITDKIRVFYCGEYGSKFQRPHYHAIIFGYDFPDKKPFMSDKRGNVVYRSDLLESCWKFGFSSIGYVTLRTCLYVAKYLQKVPDKDLGLVPPFVGMSNRPGIGFKAIRDELLHDDKVYLNGRFIKVPDYFLKILDKTHPFEVAELKDKRTAKLDVPMIYDEASGEWSLDDTHEAYQLYLNVVYNKSFDAIQKVLEKYHAIDVDKAGFPVYNSFEECT